MGYSSMRSQGLWGLVDLGSDSASTSCYLFWLWTSYLIFFLNLLIVINTCLPTWVALGFEISYEKGQAQGLLLINGSSYCFIITGEVQINPVQVQKGSPPTGPRGPEWGHQDLMWDITSVPSLGKWVGFGNVVREDRRKIIVYKTFFYAFFVCF